ISMFCLATKILTYLPFFYLIIFMTSNCQDALGRLKKGFRRPLCAMRTITLCFDKANRTYVCWHPTFFAALKILFCEQVSDSRIRPTRLAAFFCFECKK
ncbi:hypothetical protein, partial [Uruburuella suis]|uniref:hypothetical protein n=1 Tax=Uruburuella suis TaxID=252130 RepID=UPI001A9D499B